MQPETEQRSSFPFLELPPELRNNIYEYCMPDNKSMRDRDLATLQLPAITRVCRQLRQESMGYVFENRAFELCVGTNMWDRFMCDFWTRSWDPMPDSGTLGLNPTVRSFLKRASNWAIFKNIKINIYKSHHIPYVRYQRDKMKTPGREEREAFMVNYVEKARQRSSMAVMHLTVDNGELSIEVSHGYIDTIFTHALAGMKGTAEAVGKKKGLKGLKMADFLKIARTLDYNPV
ncbi:hypothetical protein AC578_1102 [Pseudocercospora eumusae]|uniref:F-box domain-containing protein n=1 Tax=Pseudocercospora eumusae TaxID=321146 RepID=A0A139HTR2_9PEZI|nr:hypothetical protein AC578_1102 [Pseudocercospora eumusae]